MRFLANENFPGAAVTVLKRAGHDIVWVRIALKDHEPQSVEVILALANAEDEAAGVRLNPNPLTVQLKAIPRPPSRPKPVAQKPAKNSTSPEAPKQAATAATSQEPQTQGVTGSTTQDFYWPQFPGH
jgi:hypothetical protein